MESVEYIQRPCFTWFLYAVPSDLSLGEFNLMPHVTLFWHMASRYSVTLSEDIRSHAINNIKHIFICFLLTNLLTTCDLRITMVLRNRTVQ